MKQLEKLFLDTTGKKAQSVTPLTPAGSDRRYFRLSADGISMVGVKGTDVDENRAFLAIDTQLREKGIAVPAVYAVSDDRLCYLQEDLGDTSLFSLIQQGEADELLKATMRELPRIQFLGAEGFDFGMCHPVPAFDKRSVMWDLNYFKYCFLKATGIAFSEPRLEDDFEQLAQTLLEEDSRTFMYRDFQSRNVMVKDGRPWFIDFQGGRRGPLGYDVVSFLWQARAGFSTQQREELIDVYLDALQPYQHMERQTFHARLRHFVLFRLLQVLGAYGFRGWFEHKAHFRQSMIPAIESLRQTLCEGFADLPYLSSLLLQVVALPRFSPMAPADGLTVEVCSFSYRSGIPEDDSENGGGFVFDCRAIHNPGRYEEYKQLTGHDDAVVRFLDNTEDMTLFLRNVYHMVDQSIERYIARGFTHLTVSFGCTGGQHRSVYAADHLAAHIRASFPQVHVLLTHREQPQIADETTRGKGA